MNYVEVVAEELRSVFPNCVDSLLLHYVLLTLTKGEEVTLEDVHDAWSVWKTVINPDHKSLVPFNELDPDIQELDRKYAEGIAQVARTISGRIF